MKMFITAFLAMCVSTMSFASDPPETGATDKSKSSSVQSSEDQSWVHVGWIYAKDKWYQIIAKYDELMGEREVKMEAVESVEAPSPEVSTPSQPVEEDLPILEDIPEPIQEVDVSSEAKKAGADQAATSEEPPTETSEEL